jgi:hypothetical protein
MRAARASDKFPKNWSSHGEPPSAPHAVRHARTDEGQRRLKTLRQVVKLVPFPAKQHAHHRVLSNNTASKQRQNDRGNLTRAKRCTPVDRGLLGAEIRLAFVIWLVPTHDGGLHPDSGPILAEARPQPRSSTVAAAAPEHTWARTRLLPVGLCTAGYREGCGRHPSQVVWATRPSCTPSCRPNPVPRHRLYMIWVYTGQLIK